MATLEAVEGAVWRRMTLADTAGTYMPEVTLRLFIETGRWQVDRESDYWRGRATRRSVAGVLRSTMQMISAVRCLLKWPDEYSDRDRNAEHVAWSLEVYREFEAKARRRGLLNDAVRLQGGRFVHRVLGMSPRSREGRTTRRVARAGAKAGDSDPSGDSDPPGGLPRPASGLARRSSGIGIGAVVV